MKANIGAVILSFSIFFCTVDPSFGQTNEFKTERLLDSVTGRTITHFASPFNENHHYYCISPWSPDETRIVFFQYDKPVEKLNVEESFPGSIWIMNEDGTGMRKLVDGLRAGYHTAAEQSWGINGKSIIFYDNSSGRRGIGIIDIESGDRQYIETEVPGTRVSPDFTKISCVNRYEWGIYDIPSKRYTRLVTRERVIALSPNKQLFRNKETHLQNTRFSPDGSKILIVHRTSEPFPTLVELYCYDFARGDLTYLAGDLHHPHWRPDGKAVLFVRREPHSNLQTLHEVDVATTEERCIYDKHVPAGHPSYHPLKSNIIITDCYGGDFGYGLSVIDLKTQEQKQLVAIPHSTRPLVYGETRFPFRNWHIWIPPRPYVNEPRPVFNADGSKVLYTSEESGRMNLYIVDTSDL